MATPQQDLDATAATLTADAAQIETTLNSIRTATLSVTNAKAAVDANPGGLNVTAFNTACNLLLAAVARVGP